jgi:hypothetical protein
MPVNALALLALVAKVLAAVGPRSLLNTFGRPTTIGKPRS